MPIEPIAPHTTGQHLYPMQYLYILFILHLQIEVDAYQDPDSSLPNGTESTLFGMMDWGRIHSRRSPKLSAHDVDESSRARPSTATFCSEAAKSLLKKLLEDVEVRYNHDRTAL